MLKYLSEMFEILGEDLAQAEVTDRKYGGTFNFDKDKLKTGDELGRGVFSKVTPDPTDPHMVRKQTKVPIGKQHKDKADGFNAYVKMIIDNHLMDNIHFPKVYKVDNKTDQNGTQRHKYQIERLQEITSLSKEEFEALVETHLLRPVHNAEQLAERIDGACTSEYERNLYIRMESLKDACETIDMLDDVSDFRLDIHEGNLMVRRTPYGPQLVISDPFGMVKWEWRHKYT